MASHVVIRQAVGFIYPAYKSLQAVMTEDNQVIVIVITIIITIHFLDECCDYLTQDLNHHENGDNKKVLDETSCFKIMIVMTIIQDDDCDDNNPR